MLKKVKITNVSENVVSFAQIGKIEAGECIERELCDRVVYQLKKSPLVEVKEWSEKKKVTRRATSPISKGDEKKEVSKSTSK